MAKIMAETDKKIALPPLWCSGICRNAMSDLCLESCAIKRDTSQFEPTKDLKLADMPNFPNPKGMTREERFTSVVIYLTKITEHLKGDDNEYIPVRRPDTHSSSSRRLSPVVQVKDLLPNLTEAIPAFSDPEERESKRVRSEELAQPAD